MNKFNNYFMQLSKYLVGILYIIICWPLLLLFSYFIKHNKSTWGGDFLDDDKLKEREKAKREEIIKKSINYSSN